MDKGRGVSIRQNQKQEQKRKQASNKKASHYSTRQVSTRQVAHTILMYCAQHDAWAKEVLRTHGAMKYLSAQEKSQVTRFVLGVVRAQGTLTQLIKAHSNTRVRLKPPVRCALQIAAFDLLYLQTPPAVAVNEGVNLVSFVSRPATAYANALLHTLAREELPRLDAARARVRTWAAQDDPQDKTSSAHNDPQDKASSTYDGPQDKTSSTRIQNPQPTKSQLEDMALVAALPFWFVKELSKAYKLSICAQLACRAFFRPSPTVFINTYAKEDSIVKNQLTEAGFTLIPSLPAPLFELNSLAGLDATQMVQTTEVIPCDRAAATVASLVAPVRDTQNVLEIGQGRGTKTLLLGMLGLKHGFAGTITSIDKDAYKVELARTRVAQSKIPVTFINQLCDGMDLDKEKSLMLDVTRDVTSSNHTFTTFDEVFLDAPCTGSGTLNRHAEIAWKISSIALGYQQKSQYKPSSNHKVKVNKSVTQGLTPPYNGSPYNGLTSPGESLISREDLSQANSQISFPKLQLQLLSAASMRVKPGGLLFYATCSDFIEENEGVIQAFLSSQRGSKFTIVPLNQLKSFDALDKTSQSFIAAQLTAEGFLRTHLLVDLHQHESFATDGHFLACLTRLC